MLPRALCWPVLALLLASCGPGGEAPEGFVLAVRFVAIDTAVVDRLRLSFRPALGTRFEAQPEMTFEGGLITMRVEVDGSLVLSIDGAHVRANLVPGTTMPVYELQIWSDDPAMRAGPLVLGSVDRGSEVIGDGTVFLPAWPPPLEQTTQIAIECGMEAATAGRCTP
jgi:hypothetical protein